MKHSLNVNVQFPTTLAELEAACATARDVGMPDNARAAGNFMTGILTISVPGGVKKPPVPDAEPEPAADPSQDELAQQMRETR